MCMHIISAQTSGRREPLDWVSPHHHVRCTSHVNDTPNLKTRKVHSGGTPSHQLGYYEMRTQPSTGKRRSYFKVLVNLDEHESPEAALQAWADEIDRLRGVGRDKRADWLEGKLERLRDLRS